MESPSTTILFLLFVTISLTLSRSRAAVTFDMLNNCSYTVWPAVYPLGGGRQLEQGQSWTLEYLSPSGNMSIIGRIWGRTGCSFDENGRGRCQTGDCDGLLECKTYGTPPNTMVEFGMGAANNQDFFDISLVDGFNLPLDFRSASGSCREIKCAADVTSLCPEELKAPGGCNGPCAVFKTDEYCCTSALGACRPTNYSMFFKNSCPDAYSYPMDDATSAFSCPGGGNKYSIVFCPSSGELPDGLTTRFGRVDVRLIIPEI